MEVERRQTEEAILLTVRGDVDLQSSPRVRKAILEAVPKAGVEVAVDLSGVGYMDSSGVAILVEGLRSAREHDKRFRIVDPSQAVRKVLELARLDSVFEVSGSS